MNSNDLGDVFTFYLMSPEGLCSSEIYSVNCHKTSTDSHDSQNNMMWGTFLVQCAVSQQILDGFP